MEKDHDLILCTNWEKMDDKDDFYLSDEWKNEDKENKDEAKKLQSEGKLYKAYIVKAINYAIYRQMDADLVYIDGDFEIVLRCESEVIKSPMEKCIEYEY